jgi:hypothetical protein
MATTKGAQADAGWGGSLGGGRLRLWCRWMRPDSLDGYQQLCRSATVSKGADGVFPTDGVLQLCGDGGRGGVFLLVTSGNALPSASAFHLQPPRGRRRWSSSVVPLRPSHSDGLHEIQVVVHMQLRHADGGYLQGVTQ